MTNIINELITYWKDIEKAHFARSAKILQEKLHTIDKNGNFSSFKNVLIVSPTDLGICRNKGRRGASFGPSAIINALSKMNQNTNINDIALFQAISQCEEQINFEKSQIDSGKKISSIIKQAQKLEKLIQLGGGHDHIYGLLKGLEVFKRPITVFNIDAHLDTRTDQFAHSGNPFRRFAKQTKLPFKLYQIGIHDFANPQENYEDLGANTEMIILTKKEIDQQDDLPHFLNENIKIIPEELNIISIDADSLSFDIMKAVSAVNHDGLSKKQFKAILDFLNNKSHPKIMGIYEYNPLYDDISSSGARFLAKTLRNFLLK